VIPGLERLGGVLPADELVDPAADALHLADGSESLLEFAR
jgi:hypothetical protein